MSHCKRIPTGRTLLATALVAAHAGAWAESEREVENVEVVGEQVESYLVDEMDTATGLGLSGLETPQSVSALSRVQLDDFELDSLNQALLAVPGVQVESVETDRTYYTSRGFDITNFQLDGVGVPATYGNKEGETDTFLYERIEVVRGASGLMSGAGNPSATVNLVRKRPTEDFRLSLGAEAGSWDKARVEGDVSGSLTDGLRGRLVVAKEDRESYLDNYAMDKTIVYGVVEKDLGASTLLTLGSSYQTSYADSPLWGALPLSHADGSPVDYDASVSTASDWAYSDKVTTDAFAELKHTFANGWQAKAYYTHAESEIDSELFYMFGLPDTESGEGLFANPGVYDLEDRHDLVDLRLTGNFHWAGREHDLLLGYNWSRGDVEDISLYPTAYPSIGDFGEWDGSFERPEYNGGTDGSDWTDEQSAFFAATRLQLTDALSLIGGARVIDWESEGYSYGNSNNTEESDRVLPYAGVVYRIGDNYSVYASRTETFMPQDDLSEELVHLDPTEGINDEIGAKGEFFDGKLIASVAYYETEQENVAESAGTVEHPETGAQIQVYEERDYDSKGYDLTLSGQLAPGLQANFSYTRVDIDNQDGGRQRDFVPANVVRLFASYRPPAMERLKVGGGINWQDDIERINEDYGYPIEQEAYATVRAFASYDVNENLSFSLNGNNLTDEKYISSLYWDQGFYAPPRSFTASVNWRY
ncbi:TonB-dependent siderophore receptor [Microbulbifer halophilus]|uniref:TonB-dependent siderophore receptor n=1 Tax=Microbulbifer halophilus TaxID=453963 RepID=A0ABW5EB92_9GAMM|nr:TonB-dependent siderophore receptor [Microbulbifer halophilus]MCW8125750.1 TonB-dependent siderophore receptor [Microbulbifer halophilus]